MRQLEVDDGLNKSLKSSQLEAQVPQIQHPQMSRFYSSFQCGIYVCTHKNICVALPLKGVTKLQHKYDIVNLLYAHYTNTKSKEQTPNSILYLRAVPLHERPPHIGLRGALRAPVGLR